jgi:hypothetical protein
MKPIEEFPAIKKAVNDGIAEGLHRLHTETDDPTYLEAQQYVIGAVKAHLDALMNKVNLESVAHDTRLAVRKEREACVKICEDYVKDMDREYKEIGEEIAGTIQARGNVHANEWVGLTDVEIHEIRLKTLDSVATNYEAYRAIEAKLKEKNSGN